MTFSRPHCSKTVNYQTPGRSVLYYCNIRSEWDRLSVEDGEAAMEYCDQLAVGNQHGEVKLMPPDWITPSVEYGGRQRLALHGEEAWVPTQCAASTIKYRLEME